MIDAKLDHFVIDKTAYGSKRREEHFVTGDQ